MRSLRNALLAAGAAVIAAAGILLPSAPASAAPVIPAAQVTVQSPAALVAAHHAGAMPDAKGPHGTGNSGSRKEWPRNLAMNWALGQRGKWYCWGGTGPTCFDCSGLVMSAYGHIGITLPRTTYEMLDSTAIYQVRDPERGDLAFYGTGHVELVTDIPGETFGAHDTGTQIGWIRYGAGWHPTAYYRVRIPAKWKPPKAG